MITHHKVDGYENFLKLMRILDCKGNVILYFHGSSNPAGESWSSTCNTSGPVILEILKQSEAKSLHFVAVGIGTYQDWSDPDCPFRTDERIFLKELPTLLLWRSIKRINGKNCANPYKSVPGADEKLIKSQGVMITYHKVEGYEECLELLKKLKDEKNILMYFAGSVNEAGENWCPDCKAAEPIVLDVVKENEEKTFHFVHVAVGSREQWKDPECPFRKDEKFKLTSVPTLMMLNSVERLNDTECQDKENIAMILENVE